MAARSTPAETTGLHEVILAAPVSARLRASRARATRACDVSRTLCALAYDEVNRARELRSLSSDQARSWRAWHRLWRRVIRGAPMPSSVVRGERRAIVRICMYCARVHAALPLVGGHDETDRVWRPVPSWVRDRLRDSSFPVVLSHGMWPDVFSPAYERLVAP